MRTISLAALIGMIAIAAAPASAQRMKPDPIPEVAGPILGPIARERTITLGGRKIAYRAVWKEYPLAADGRDQATISATAYIRKDVKQSANRPVMFVFNGGPGASSSPLHFSAFGPRVRERGQPGSPAPYIDNPDSPIDAADLVFVDPVGTGFSRVLPGGKGNAFWGPTGDADSVRMLIHSWLRENGRTASPVFIAGESYGGFRLLSILRDVKGIKIAGLVMISPAMDMSYLGGATGYDMQPVFALPSMAAAAWFHDKVDRRGLTVEQYFETAEQFASGEYMSALFKGSALPEAEKRAVAQKMSDLIGLSADTLFKADLRPTTDLFVRELLAADGKAITRLDARRASPVRAPTREGRPMAANELGLGATNVSKSPDIARYMREEIGFPAQRDYVSLTLDVNFNWNWREPTEEPRAYFNPTAYLGRVMAANPKLKLLVVGGLYDIAVPISAVRYTLRHADVPMDRVDFMVQPAGHSAFSEDRPGVAAKVRSMLVEATR